MSLDMMLYLLYFAVVYILLMAAAGLFYGGLVYVTIVLPIRAYRRRTGRTQPPPANPYRWAPPAA